MSFGEFWWFAVVVTGALGSTEAIFTPPSPDTVHGIMGFGVDDSSGKPPKIMRSDAVRMSGENRANEPSSRRDPNVYENKVISNSPYESGVIDGNHNREATLMNSGAEEVDNQSPLDPWSIVWYIGSFGGLVAFFLIVSCSEWCCRRSARPVGTPYAQRPTEAVTITRNVTDTPPPPYHLFAPPPYDSVNYNDLVDKTTGEKLDIYVISVPITVTEQTVTA